VKMEKNSVCVEKDPVKMEKFFAWMPQFSLSIPEGQRSSS
jgi:hypothetical protein